MKLKNIIIGVLIFGMVFGAMQLFSADLVSNYSNTNATLDSSEFDRFSTLSSGMNKTKEIKEQVMNGTIDEATAFESLSISGFTATKLIAGSATDIQKLFNGLADIFDINPIIIWTITAIIMVMIMFGILGYVFRWDG